MTVRRLIWMGGLAFAGVGLPLTAQVPTRGFFVGGHVTTAPGFDVRYVPGDYPAPGLVRHISEADADIGATSFSGGMRGIAGWGFTRFLAAHAGFDFLGGKFKYPGGESYGSSQMTIFAGLRLNAPVGSIAPYLAANVGGLAVTAEAGVDQYCYTNGGCFAAGDGWDGGYWSGTVGIEFGARRAGRGTLSFDIHAERIDAQLDGDAGAGERLERMDITRIAVGMIWRARRT